MQARQTAYKVWLASLLNGKYVRREGEWEPNYVEVNDIQVSRVNVIGTVVEKFVSNDNSYASITVDDGSATIRLKTFKEDNKLVENLMPGNLVLSIAKVREYNNEIYLSPEIIKALDNPNWELLRKIELVRAYGKMQSMKEIPVYETTQSQVQTTEEEKISVEEESVVEEAAITTNFRQKLISLIEKNQTESGAEIQRLVEESGMPEAEVNAAITDLLKGGEIYQHKPGFVKIV